MGRLSRCSQLTFMGQCLYARDFAVIIPFAPDNGSIVELGESTAAQGGNCHFFFVRLI